MLGASITTSKSTEAYHHLREMIHSGHLNGGEHLSESKAARLLGMSRGTIRESLVRLEADGLVENKGKRRRRRVAYLEDQDRDEVLLRYELRERIESGAARLAAKNMNGWQIDHLRTLAEQYEQLERSGPSPALYDTNLAFIRYLVSNCGNRLIQKVWESQHLAPFTPRSTEFEKQIIAHTPESERDNSFLLEVINAIAAHDADRAEHLMEQRVRIITEAIRKTFWGSAQSGKGGSGQASRRG